MKYDLSARIVRQVFKRSLGKQLAFMKGDAWAREVMRKASALYRGIVLRSPTIGGRKNPLTINVLTVAFVAAIYKSAEGDLSPEETGTAFSDAGDRAVAFRLFMRLASKKNFTIRWQDKRNQLALDSQKRRYPADFVSEFVYGPTPDEYGIVYRECGICKLLERESCAELAPYMCKFDYVMAKYMGAKLIRTKTIADGDGLCDFWFRKKGLW